jgi:hypothetical protein
MADKKPPDPRLLAAIAAGVPTEALTLVVCTWDWLEVVDHQRVMVPALYARDGRFMHMLCGAMCDRYRARHGLTGNSRHHASALFGHLNREECTAELANLKEAYEVRGVPIYERHDSDPDTVRRKE